MTRQRIFNKVVTALAKQGYRSTDHYHDICMFRDGKGGKCAAGHLFPDRAYDPEMEGQGIRDVLNSLEDYPELNSWVYENIWFVDEKELIEDLQITHDEERAWASLESFKEEFERIAIKYNLKTTYLNKIEKLGG